MRNRGGLRDYRGNPLPSGAKIALGLLGVAAVGGIAYAVTRPKTAAAATPTTAASVTTTPTGTQITANVPGAVASTLSAGQSYTGLLQSLGGDPTTAVQAAYPGATVTPVLSGPTYTVSFVWNGTDGSAPPAVSGASWLTLTSSATGLTSGG